jgi:soluble epoxide hydrolase/lipid-phosphate phosphatase
MYAHDTSIVQESAANILVLQIESFLSILYPRDPAAWKTDFAPVGALKACLLADKQLPMPDYITEHVILFLPFWGVSYYSRVSSGQNYHEC